VAVVEEEERPSVLAGVAAEDLVASVGAVVLEPPGVVVAFPEEVVEALEEEASEDVVKIYFQKILTSMCFSSRFFYLALGGIGYGSFSFSTAVATY
jgi:hypothetical protein